MGGMQDMFGQMWKEYAMSDSRYLTSDPFVLCMETVTAVRKDYLRPRVGRLIWIKALWGPLSFLMVYFIVVSHPLRHPLQMIISLGQIYGDVLYYATSMFDHYHKNLTYCRPEGYYFWVYYFMLNFFWIVIPSGEYLDPTVYTPWLTLIVMLASSMRWTARAFKALNSISRSVQGNGTVANPKANGHISVPEEKARK